MDLSVNTIEWRKLIAKHKITALLDGKRVEHCFRASEEKGFVEVYRTDSAGHFIMSGLGKVATERRHGVVKILLEPLGNHKST